MIDKDHKHEPYRDLELEEQLNHHFAEICKLAHAGFPKGMMVELTILHREHGRPEVMTMGTNDKLHQAITAGISTATGGEAREMMHESRKVQL